MKALPLAAALLLSGCMLEGDPAPSPNDNPAAASGISGGTPGDVGITGSGTGLGTGTNASSDTRSPEPPRTAAPAVQVSGDGLDFRPAASDRQTLGADRLN